MSLRPFFFIALVALFACDSSKSNIKKRKERIASRQAVKTASAGAVGYGTQKKPIRFYFTPSGDKAMIEESARTMLDFLSKETGLHYEMHVPANYDELISAFGKNEAHVAMMNSLGYVRAHEAHGARAVLKAVRYNSPNYFGQIIANVSSGIKTIEDIAGKSMVFTDSSSGSGYLYPKKILRSNNIHPRKVSFAGKHDRVVEILYKGIADAGATYYSAPKQDGTIRDARARIQKKYPDVAKKVRIIAVTEPIPNDPVVFAKEVPRQMQFDISLALVKFIASEEGLDAMNSIYAIQGFVRCSDADYDGLREALSYNQ